MEGIVLGIFISAEAGTPMQSLDEAYLEKGCGIVGDRYYSATGTFSERLKDSFDYEVTLIESEQIDHFNISTGLALDYGVIRRNVVTKGVNLNELIGVDFRVGEVILQGIRLCEPCAYLAGLVSKEVLTYLVHRAGIRAKIIKGGIIRPKDDVTVENRTRKIFGERAVLYTTSHTHRDPIVLQKMVEWASPQKEWSCLDVATGTGHTAFAFAPHLSLVVGVDLTLEMLQEAIKLRDKNNCFNTTFCIGDAHSLPFPNESFDLVSCRRAAHHFSNITQALDGMNRVLKKGGRLLIDDRSVPEDDFVDPCMNQLDYYHDESNIRQYRKSEWENLLQKAGFVVKETETYTQHRPLTALTEGVSQENINKIHKTINSLTPHQKEALNLTELEGEVYLNHWYIMILAVK